MPFKTRRQKISAAHRRFILTAEEKVVYQKKETLEVKKSQGGVSETPDVPEKVKGEVQRIEDSYRYVLLDLVKTAAFAGIILAAQLATLLLKKS